MRIDRLDHLVLTVADIERTITFYEAVLGMEHVRFGEERHALQFGNQRIHLHREGREVEPKARRPTPGSADLCFIMALPMPAFMIHLARCEVPVEEGPVERIGAAGTLLSVYVRDPDDNLIEISNAVG